MLMTPRCQPTFIERIPDKSPCLLGRGQSSGSCSRWKRLSDEELLAVSAGTRTLAAKRPRRPFRARRGILLLIGRTWLAAVEQVPDRRRGSTVLGGCLGVKHESPGAEVSTVGSRRGSVHPAPC